MLRSVRRWLGRSWFDFLPAVIKKGGERYENTSAGKGWRPRQGGEAARRGCGKSRIMDMGMTKGVEVYVRKVAPLGDPVEVNVRGYELSIRKADADMIEIE